MNNISYFKNSRWLLAAVVGLALQFNAGATLQTYTYNSGFQNGGAIPDGNVNGLADSRLVLGRGDVIVDVQITLNISGGYNGDLYAYLTHGAQSVVLLNRVGVGTGDPFGYGDAGMNVTLANGGANGNIHWYGGAGIPTGTYSPDGRTISPSSNPSAFDPNGSGDFSVFQNTTANGTWTLFLSDGIGSDGGSTLNSWSLTISTVPEPVNVALLAFGLVMTFVILRKHSPRLQKLWSSSPQV